MYKLYSAQKILKYNTILMSNEFDHFLWCVCVHKFMIQILKTKKMFDHIFRFWVY